MSVRVCSLFVTVRFLSSRLSGQKGGAAATVMTFKTSWRAYLALFLWGCGKCALGLASSWSCPNFRIIFNTALNWWSYTERVASGIRFWNICCARHCAGYREGEDEDWRGSHWDHSWSGADVLTNWSLSHKAVNAGIIHEKCLEYCLSTW